MTHVNSFISYLIYSRSLSHWTFAGYRQKLIYKSIYTILSVVLFFVDIILLTLVDCLHHWWLNINCQHSAGFLFTRTLYPWMQPCVEICLYLMSLYKRTHFTDTSHINPDIPAYTPCLPLAQTSYELFNQSHSWTVCTVSPDWDMLCSLLMSHAKPNRACVWFHEWPVLILSFYFIAEMLESSNLIPFNGLANSSSYDAFLLDEERGRLLVGAEDHIFLFDLININRDHKQVRSSLGIFQILGKEEYSVSSSVHFPLPADLSEVHYSSLPLLSSFLPLSVSVQTGLFIIPLLHLDKVNSLFIWFKPLSWTHISLLQAAECGTGESKCWKIAEGNCLWNVFAHHYQMKKREVIKQK